MVSQKALLCWMELSNQKVFKFHYGLYFVINGIRRTKTHRYWLFRRMVCHLLFVSVFLNSFLGSQRNGNRSLQSLKEKVAINNSYAYHCYHTYIGWLLIQESLLILAWTAYILLIYFWYHSSFWIFLVRYCYLSCSIFSSRALLFMHRRGRTVCTLGLVVCS